MEWRPNEIRWFVDDTLYHTAENPQTGVEDWPYDQPFHLLLNVAVGGDWGGVEGVDPDIWPQRMEIDYVRVYDLGDSPVLDADGDELIDAVDPDDDNDELSDLEELEYGTNPFVADTDGDGFNDGVEVDAGSSPSSGGETPDTLGDAFQLLNNTDFSQGLDGWGVGRAVYDARGILLSLNFPTITEDDLLISPEGSGTLSLVGPRSGAVEMLIGQATYVVQGLEPGDILTFRGTASSTGTAVTEASILVFSFDDTALPQSVYVPIDSEGGDFLVTHTLELGDVAGISLAFRIYAESGTSGSITFSDPSATLEKPTGAEVFDLRFSSSDESNTNLSWQTWFLTNRDLWSSPEMINWTPVAEGIEGNGERVAELLPISDGQRYFKVTVED